MGVSPESAVSPHAQKTVCASKSYRNSPRAPQGGDALAGSEQSEPVSFNPITESLIDEAFRAIAEARTPEHKRIAGSVFTRLIQQRNQARTAEEVVHMERAKGLR